MMMVLAALVLLGALQAAASRDSAGSERRYGLDRPLPRKRGSIRLATYNVQNLFDHVADAPSRGGPPGNLELAITAARAEALAAAIRAVNADVLGLQEVESLEALRWFRDTYLPDAGYRHLASFDATGGIECSLMSRLEITDAFAWSDRSLDGVVRKGPGWAPAPPGDRRGLTFERPPLQARLRVSNGYELTVLVVHCKSGRGFDFRREAEALRIAQFVSGLAARDPSENLVVMGDFNAAPWDKSLRACLAAGLVDTLAHRSLGGPEGPLYKTHESDRVVDYILLNAAALPEMVLGSAHVYGTPAAGTGDAATERPPGYASDHYPVVVDLVPRDGR